MMTWHTELACDRLFGKEQELEIHGGKKEKFMKQKFMENPTCFSQ